MRFFAFALLSGCAAMVTRDSLGRAKDNFSADLSCPTRQVSVSLASSPDWAPKQPPPPPDIAANPERLKIYQRQHPEDKGVRWVNAEGCGQKVLYRCDTAMPCGDGGYDVCLDCAAESPGNTPP